MEMKDIKDTPVIRVTVFYNQEKKVFTHSLESTLVGEKLTIEERIALLETAVTSLKKQLKGSSK